VLERWYRAVEDVEPAIPTAGFLNALADDLNTPLAIAELHKLTHATRAGNMRAGQRLTKAWPSELKAGANLFGLLTARATDWRSETATAKVDVETVVSLINARTAARAARDFKESDRIRDELAAMGVVLKDSKDGTTWEIAR
jgi:cysteinyl-tRNA synthetase